MSDSIFLKLSVREWAQLRLLLIDAEERLIHEGRLGLAKLYRDIQQREPSSIAQNFSALKRSLKAKSEELLGAADQQALGMALASIYEKAGTEYER